MCSGVQVHTIPFMPVSIMGLHPREQVSETNASILRGPTSYLIVFFDEFQSIFSRSMFDRCRVWLIDRRRTYEQDSALCILRCEGRERLHVCFIAFGRNQMSFGLRVHGTVVDAYREHDEKFCLLPLVVPRVDFTPVSAKYVPRGIAADTEVVNGRVMPARRRYDPRIRISTKVRDPATTLVPVTKGYTVTEGYQALVH